MFESISIAGTIKLSTSFYIDVKIVKHYLCRGWEGNGGQLALSHHGHRWQRCKLSAILHSHLIFMCKSWYLPGWLTCRPTLTRDTCHRIWTRICKLLSAKLNKRASFDTFPDHNDKTQWLFGRINQIDRPQNVESWIHNNHGYSCKLNIGVFVQILTETIPRSVMWWGMCVDSV